MTHEPDPTPDDSPQQRADVGILFVHGIGEQTQGAMLTVWADAVIGLVETELGRDRVKVGAAVLRPPSSSTDPAFVDVEIDVPERDSVRWRLSEAWWANAFAPPTFRELAVWGLLALPFTVLAHFVSGLRRAWAPGTRLMVRIASVVQSLVFIALVVVLLPFLSALVAVLLLLGLLPIPWLRRLIGSAQRSLSQSVGDSYVFVGSRSRAAAIVHQTTEDLRWLARRCESLVVVAHSQGAEVAHRAVRAVRPGSLKAFVTLGSGQTKLRAIEHGVADNARWKIWLAPGGAVVMAAGIVVAWDQYARNGTDDAIFSLTVAAAGLAMAATGVGHAANATKPDADEIDPGAELGWLDLWATHDPVANGPVFEFGDDTPGFIRSNRVRNRASYWSDHTSYVQNAEGVIARVVDLACASGAEPVVLRGDHRPTPELALRRRTWRVGWLRFSRWFVVTTGIAVGLLLRDDLDSLATPVTTALAEAIRAISGSDLLGGAVERSDVSILAGSATLVVATWATYEAVAALWRRWDLADPSAATRGGYPLWAPEFVVLVESLLAVAGLAVLATTWPGLREHDSLLVDVASLVFVILLSYAASAFLTLVCGTFLVPLEASGWVRAGHARPTPRQQLAVLVPYFTVVAAAVFVVIPAPEQTWVFVVLAVGPLAALYVIVPLLSGNGVAIAVMDRLRPTAASPPYPRPTPAIENAMMLRTVCADAFVPGLSLEESELSTNDREEVVELVLKLLKKQAGEPLPARTRGSVRRILRDDSNRDPDQLVDLLNGLLPVLDEDLREYPRPQ